MQLMKFRALSVIAIVYGLIAAPAFAAITISGTRVIYPAQDREVSVRLSNTGDRPALVQAWLDQGNAGAAPNEIQVPFVLLPSVFRVEPHRGQAMRIMFTGADMPKDRESVYWLNVLEIPPKPQDVDERNMIQLAFRTRIKMFYRPASLQDDPTVARGKLEWHVVTNEKGDRRLRVDNPSAYYISFGRVEVKTGNRVIELQTGMAPPFGYVDLAPQPGKKLDIAVPATISYTILNDFGTEVSASAQLGDASTAKVEKSMNE